MLTCEQKRNRLDLPSFGKVMNRVSVGNGFSNYFPSIFATAKLFL
jgi:hypothetical protein